MLHHFIRASVVVLMLCPGVSADEKAKMLDSLLKARQETLKRLLEVKIEVLKEDRCFPPSLVDTSRHLRDAQLVRIINPADRLAAHERYVKHMREHEKVEQLKFEAGRIAIVNLAEAKRLRVEAELAQVRERLMHKAGAEDLARERILHDERREALRTIVKARLAEYEAGRGTFVIFLEVSRQLLDAELELASKRAERLALYERHLKLVEKCAEVNEALFKAGRLSLPDYASGKAGYLADEIRHLREKAGDKPMADEAARIRKLLSERRDTLREAVKARQEEFEAGKADAYCLLDASHLLLQAELELLEKAEERLAAHQAHRERMRVCERKEEALYKAGRRPLSEVLQSRAARLDAEIGLVRAGGKVGN